MTKTPTFVQISSHGYGTSGGSYLYGLTSMGQVYEWNDGAKVWVLLRNDDDLQETRR